MSDKAGIIVTPEMSHAGYKTLKQMASEHGYGWGFSMVGEHTIELAMGQVFRDMIEAAPKGWMPIAYTNPGPLSPLPKMVPDGGVGEHSDYTGLPSDEPPPEAA